jgi:peptide/nickel transport system permease protein
MTTYIVHRLIQAVVVLIIVSLIVFAAIRLLPGDPILLFLSQEERETLTAENVKAMRHQFGLDKPLLMQYIDWVSGLFRGDFGTSLFYREDVSKLLIERLPVTLYLGLIAFVMSAVLGISAGVLSAVRRGSFLDGVVTMFANTGIGVPIFWLGILMIFLFSLKLRWLPVCGYVSPLDDFWLSTKHLIMPVICLMIFGLASGARQTRSSMLEVIRQDYIRTAWAKGLKEHTIVLRHALKNGLIPIITLMGTAISHILGGSVLIETVFNIPGMGRLAVSAVLSQDYAIVQAVVLLTGMMVVLFNLLVDICYGWLDPRIRYG